MFPPNRPDGDYFKNSGYCTGAEECFFYDFAVLGYDLRFKYAGKWYYFMTDTDCVWRSDDSFSAKLERYENGNAVLQYFCIEGVPLCLLVNSLEEFEPM